MWAGLGRAALFTVMFLPGTIVLPLLLAILIERVTNRALASAYRVILLITAVIPSTLIFVLWKWMYNYQSGPINHLLVETLGLFTLIFGRLNRASPTYTWTIFMYDEAFRLGLWRRGYAAAIGMIGAIAMMAVMVVLLRIFRPKG
jgi:ABC-type sugar transport system permease subunit